MTALRWPIQRSAINPPSSGVKYTNPLYNPKISEANAWVERGPTMPSTEPRNCSRPATFSKCPGSSNWFTMYSTRSAVMP